MKISGVSLLILSVLFLSSLILLQFVLYKQVSGRLKQVVKANEAFVLHVGNLDFNVFERSVTVTQVIANDTSGFFSLNADTIRIEGINPLSMIFQRQLTISEVILSEGSLEINPDKKPPVAQKNQIPWLIENVVVKNWHVGITQSDNSARFNIKLLKAGKVHSKSFRILPMHTAEASITDVFLARRENTYSIDSIRVKLNEGISTIQVERIDVLNLIRFASNNPDWTSIPFSELTIDKLQAEIPVYYFKYLSLKKRPWIEIPYLQIDGPSIHLRSIEESYESNEEISFKWNPEDIMFQQLIIQNGKIVVYNDSVSQLELRLNQLKAHNLRTDSTCKTYPVFADALNLSLSDINYGFSDQIHRIKISRLNYSTGLNRIQADGLQIGSELDSEEYFRRRKFQTDMPSLIVHAVMFDGLNVASLLNDNKFRFRKVWADTLGLKMIRDKNYPYDLKNFPPMIQDQILQLPFRFSVDTVSVQHGEITYYEIPKGSTLEDAGMFQFKSASLNIYQCTNDSTLLSSNDTLLIHFRGKLYGQGLLDVFVDIPLLSKNYWHRVYGTIGKFNAREFNRIAVPAAAVKINKGNVNGGEFYFEANNEFSSGNAELLFEKLKVTVLNQTGSAAKSQADFLKSIIANVFMVHDNPEPGKDVMVGKIYFKRNTNRWMINFWWKSLLQGVRSIVFAKEVQLREMSDSFNEYKKLRKQREEMDQLMQE